MATRSISDLDMTEKVPRICSSAALPANMSIMSTMTRAYSITAERLAAEAEAAGGDPSAIDVSKVVVLDDLELRDLGPTDVRFKVLAVSAEHNIDHAATADTINIAEARGGRMFPGNSALGEVVEVGRDVTKFSAGDIVVTHCNGDPDENGFPKRIWAYDMPD